MLRICGLCDSEAFLYCGVDSAFLCRNCDARVHQANFIAAHHVRKVLCFNCQSFTGIKFSGTVAPSVTSVCRSCSLKGISGGDGNLLSSSMSDCVSSTKSWTTTKLTDEDPASKCR